MFIVLVEFQEKIRENEQWNKQLVCPWIVSMEIAESQIVSERKNQLNLFTSREY